MSVFVCFREGILWVVLSATNIQFVRNETTATKILKLQFSECPLGSAFNSESVPIKLHVILSGVVLTCAYGHVAPLSILHGN